VNEEALEDALYGALQFGFNCVKSKLSTRYAVGLIFIERLSLINVLKALCRNAIGRHWSIGVQASSKTSIPRLSYSFPTVNLIRTLLWQAYDALSGWCTARRISHTVCQA
jgi:hypothetical protein